MWYKSTYELLARRGLRVLALAYKKIINTSTTTAASTTIMNTAVTTGTHNRSAIECDLWFGGFIAFECKTRADSKVVVQSLQQSGHYVMMLTGKSMNLCMYV